MDEKCNGIFGSCSNCGSCDSYQYCLEKNIEQERDF